MSIRSVVRRHGLDWHLIQALVSSWAAPVAEHRRSRRCRVLLVDETSMRKRHRYVTVLQDGDTGQILAMVPHRNAAALNNFFIEQGPRWCRGVSVVVSDGSKSYRTAIDQQLGGARHVLDR
jgi:transposase